jgi:hypothetical protein
MLDHWIVDSWLYSVWLRSQEDLNPLPPRAPPKQWQWIGSELPIVDIKSVVNGPNCICIGFSNFNNKHCSKIFQETLLNSVSNDLLPLMVGQSHDSFTLVSRMWCYFNIVSRPLIWCAWVQIGGTQKQTWVSVMLPVFVFTSEWQAKKCWNARLLPLSAV